MDASEFNLFKAAAELPKRPVEEVMGWHCEDEEDVHILADYIKNNYSPKEIDAGVKKYMASRIPEENAISEDLPFVKAKRELWPTQ